MYLPYLAFIAITAPLVNNISRLISLKGTTYTVLNYQVNFPIILMSYNLFIINLNYTGSDFYKSSYPFKCDECSRTYKRREGLRRHVKFECGVGPAFPCPICDRQITQKYNLRRHLIEVHKVERSQLSSYEVGPTFKCTFCPFRAQLKTDLQKHVRIEHCN